MSKNRETLPLIIALLSTLLLIGGGLWWLNQRFSWIVTDGEPAATGQTTGQVSSTDLQNRLSAGERILTANPTSDAALQAQRQAGAAAYAAGNYPQAVAEFEAILKARRNDPEVLIYLNNARIATQPAYEIAVSVPISGTQDTALEMLRGVAQAQTEFNRQNPAVPLKVLIADDGYSPAIARQIAGTLVNNSQILGVVGHHSSDMSLAAGEVYTQGKLVMISPVSTSVKLSDFSPYVFRTVPSDFVAARALARHMVSQNQQKAALFFNSQSAYSQSLKSEFASALSLEGGQVVSEFDLTSSSFNPTSSVRQAVQQGATTLALLPDSGQLDRALQVVQVNQQQLKILGGDSVYSPKTLAVSGAAAEGAVIAVPWHILANQNSPFAQLSRELWGADVNWRTAMSYDATTALLAALTAEPNPTRQSVQAALVNPSFSVTNGSSSVKFLPSGDRNQSIQLVTVAPGNRSGHSYDFVPLP